MNDLDHLAGLASALVRARRPFAATGTDGLPALRLWDPATPRVGIHVVAAPDRAGAWWFWASVGVPLARCHDLDTAVETITDALASPADLLLAARDHARARRPRIV
ncbi:hypothetical protein [Actinomadura parmotrematis]|uniref:Uncharacterized protein n=1 Tax=Actinomadura parmotrematis TaxID=2864039 RepID=A0ABS7FR51_9ACTN|nr:hypothetical protein [Actinomadura parmotrematis]MBW8482883.1 hypothetical protein [Actinomadura parmotrematis]